MKQGAVRKLLDVAVDSMQTYDTAFGAYPYPEVDVVLSDFETFGGMEYPQIVFSNPYEGIVAHELGHQWWYGIVGDDQYHAPWLDEAFASYASTLVAGQGYCPRGSYWPSKRTRITNDMGYWNSHQNEYWVIYFKGACALLALDARFGHDRFLSILRDYADAHWLGVSTTREFVEAIEAAAAIYIPGWEVSRFWADRRIDPSA
jgi:aminopeptidase N